MTNNERNEPKRKVAATKKPKPGSRVGRMSSEPEGGALTLTDPKIYDGSAAKKIKKLPNSQPVTA